MSKKFKVLLILPLLLMLIFSYPLKLSIAAGEGSCSVTPTSVIKSSTGNNFTFTFTATGLALTDNMNSGELSITFPSGFSTPQTTSPSGTGYVTIDITNSSGITADLLTNLDSTSGWSTSTTNITLSSESTIKKEGNSLKIHVAGATTAGGLIYFNLSSSLNWTSYKKVGFWIRTSLSTSSSSDLQFLISENANLVSPGITLSIPVLNKDQWYFIVLDLPTTITTRDNVLSFGIKYNVDYFGTNDGDIYIDDMFLGPTSKPIISGNDIKVRLLSVYKDQTVIIKYNNVTAPSTEGNYTFTTKTRKESSESLMPITLSPSVSVSSTTYKLVFISGPSSVTAGVWTTSTFVVQRQDSSSNPVTTGTTTVTITTNSPYGKGKFNTSPTGGSSTLTLTISSGQHSTAPFYYYDETAGDCVITASSSGLVSGTHNITINPASISKLVVTLPGQTFESGKGNSGTPTTQKAGDLFEIKIRACDNFNNVVTTYSGSKTITFSGPNCCDSYKPKYNTSEANCSTTEASESINFTNGLSEDISVILYKAETVSIHVTDGTYIGDSSNFTLSGGALQYFGLQFPTISTKIAGQSFPLIIEARDGYCNPTKFTGTVDLSLVKSDYTPILPPPSPLMSPISVTFNNESSKTIQVTIYKSYDDAYIKVQNHDNIQVGYSAPIDIWHGDLHYFRFDNIGPYKEQGTPFSITINAED
ncbi:MAG: hypothetical protein ACP5KX_07935, partial [Caldisericia bacterium]